MIPTLEHKLGREWKSVTGETLCLAGDKSTTVLQLRAMGKQWQLDIDDVPIEAKFEGGHSLWRWTPSYYAGQVQACLKNDEDGSETVFHIDISPDETKLGAELFAKMLTQLRAAELELLLGNSPAQARFGSAGEFIDCLVAFARLRRHGQAFLVALENLSLNPIRQLRQTRQRALLGTARQIDRRTLELALRDANASAHLNHRTRRSRPSAILPSVDIPTLEEHLDAPANRCIKALVLDILQRIEYCRGGLTNYEHEAKKPKKLVKDLVLGPQRWEVRLEQLHQLERNIRRMLAAPFLAQVTRPETTAAGLTAISAQPLYARVFRLGQALLGKGIDEGGQDQLLWLPMSWGLYERWCYAMVRQRLRELPVTNEAVRAEGPHRSWSADLGDWRLWLGFQVEFPAKLHVSELGFSSITKRRVPDIILTIEGNAEHRWLVLDAKYTSETKLLEQPMETAHIYHDSLRWKGSPPSLALLMIPRLERDLKYLSDPEFYREHGVGAVTANSEQFDAIEQLVRGFVGFG